MGEVTKDLPVVVYDPKGTVREHVETVFSMESAKRDGPFHFEYISDLNALPNIEGPDHTWVPKYVAAVLDMNDFTMDNIGVLSELHQKAPLMQVYGVRTKTEITSAIENRARTATEGNFVRIGADIRTETGQAHLLLETEQRMPAQGTVRVARRWVKVGGSLIDRVNDDKNPDSLLTFVKAPVDPENLIITVGGGHSRDVLTKSIGLSPSLMANSLQTNAKSLQELYGSKAMRLQPHEFSQIPQSNGGKALLLTYAPSNIAVRYGLDLRETDAHLFGMVMYSDVPEGALRRVIAIKRTGAIVDPRTGNLHGGIYKIDPRAGYNTEVESVVGLPAWAYIQRSRNKPLQDITIDDFENVDLINNEGSTEQGDPDGDRNHLLERSAAALMKYPGSVDVYTLISGATDELYPEMLGEGRVHIVTGDPLPQTVSLRQATQELFTREVQGLPTGASKIFASYQAKNEYYRPSSRPTDPTTESGGMYIAAAARF